MNFRSIFWAMMVSFAFLEGVSGQQFQDLNFESAKLVTVSSGMVQFAQAFPGWTLTVTNPFSPDALYDTVYLDSAGISIIDNTANTPSFLAGDVIQGRYTAILQSGNGYPPGGGMVPSDVTLSQTGMVPPGTESLEFEIEPLLIGAGNFEVTLDGQPLSLAPLGTGSNYELFGADISQWAGQTAQLAFTVFAQVPHRDDEYLALDAIQFSSQLVPEPGVLSLLALGGLLLIRAIRRAMWVQIKRRAWPLTIIVGV
ncbi:MAG TPA: hypothetical protein VMH87_06555 [Pseudomonadales bacterium]|nr:hypothetical protein [Pseudomonadales bacterium]